MFPLYTVAKKYVYLHCITNHNGLGCSSHLISESKLAEVVLAALQGKIQQISGLEQRLDEINEIPKNQRRLKSVEEHMKMLEQEEQKYQTLRRQLYEDMSNGIVSKDAVIADESWDMTTNRLLPYSGAEREWNLLVRPNVHQRYIRPVILKMQCFRH